MYIYTLSTDQTPQRPRQRPTKDCNKGIFSSNIRVNQNHDASCLINDTTTVLPISKKTIHNAIHLLIPSTSISPLSKAVLCFPSPELSSPSCSGLQARATAMERMRDTILPGVKKDNPRLSTHKPRSLTFRSLALHIHSLIEAKHAIALQVTVDPIWRLLLTGLSNMSILLYASVGRRV